MYITRINAACEENGINHDVLHEGLGRCEVQLSKKVLADLAIWEPRTFKSLTNLAWCRLRQDNYKPLNEFGEAPEGVFTSKLVK